MRVAVPLLMLLAVSLAACGDGDDPAEPQPTVTVTVTETATPSEPDASPSPSPAETEAETGDPCAAIEPFGAQLAYIVVSSPTPGAVLASGDSVTGCGNTFEASYQWELLDGQGNVLAGDVGTMTCGNGCHGEFEFTVDFGVDEQQIGTLRVFESSAEDGSPVHVNSIPVRLEP